MDDPGSLAGRINSPIPDLGPLLNHRISLDILNNETATVYKAPDNSTMQS